MYSLSIYFPTNLTHLDSELFLIFCPAGITMSEIKGSFPSSSSCYIQANYHTCYRKFAALTQTWPQATKANSEDVVELGRLTIQGFGKVKLMNYKNVSLAPSRVLHTCWLERKSPNHMGVGGYNGKKKKGS